MTFKIFIGWDPREAEVAEVCKHSILKYATIPVEIHMLKQQDLRDKGIYNREIDQEAATEFTFTRFLVPHLCEYKGWAIFVDCDFLFTHDIRELFQQINDDIAVSVVQHDYVPTNTIKMDGKVQHQYPRKNWSSLMLFNCSHPDTQQLTADVVNSESGAYLHRLEWTENIDSLDKSWNWLINWYHEPADGTPKALHYTEGGPWFPNYEKTEYGAHWANAYHEWKTSLIPNPAPSRFDTVPTEITALFDDILKYRIDPQEQYYADTIGRINQTLVTMNNQAAFAVEADTMTDTNSKHQSKGAEYDPYLASFIQGSGGQITVWDQVKDSTVPLVLRGVTKRKHMEACRQANRDFYYIDTGYFGNGSKKIYHRITKNDMQNLGPVISRPRDRLAATKYRARKFRGGANILLTPPSQKLLAVYDLDLTTWIHETKDRLRLYTDRNIIIREKVGRTARVTTDTMEMALERDIHCLVTFSSIAAVEAVLLGKPAIVLGPSAAYSVCSNDCKDIENPFIPTLDQVEEWAAHLAYCQFTEVDMKNGFAWQILNDNA